WGELTDPESSLRGAGREIDLLNVRYLISMRPKGATLSSTNDGQATDAAKTSEAPAPAATPAQDFPEATQRYGDFMFAGSDMGLPNAGAGKSLRFTVAPVEADRIALVTNLSWSEDVPDGATVGRVRLKTQDGRAFEFALRAGADTSEWAHDRADIRARVRHKRAAVAASYPVSDDKGKYEGHTYVNAFALPERAFITGGEIVAEVTPKWPDLLLSVFRISLADTAAGKTYPLRREWFTVERQPLAMAAAAGAKSQAVSTITPKVSTKGAAEGVGGVDGVDAAGASNAARWRLVGRTAREEVYENARALPRAWLAPEARALDEEATLKVIRTGLLPDGSKWEPQRTALVESEPGAAPASSSTQGGSAEVVRYEPNRVDVKTKAVVPSLLVLAENHYPGWRAYLDGQAVGVLRVNYNQRGVQVPAGEHEVRFVYRPKSVLFGAVVSLLTAALLMLWWRGLRRSKERAEGVSA
ncbi:MAG: YfhO family protein, partial [Pyrinomonadaceae bacterium]